MRLSALLALLSLATACAPRLEPEGNPIFTCAENADCPGEGRLCHPVLGICVDTIEPVALPEVEVAFVSPVAGELSVSLTPTVVLAFNMDVVPASVDSRVSLTTGGNAVATTVKPTDVANTFTLVPDAPLEAEALHTLTVAAGVEPAEDRALVLAADFTSTFTTRTAPDTTPPAPITGLTVDRRSDTEARLSWTLPGDTDLAGVMVLRQDGDRPSGRPTDGIPYGAGVTLGNSEVVMVTVGTSHVDIADTSGRYDYGVVTFDTSNNYGETVVGPFVDSQASESCANAGSVFVTSRNSGELVQLQFTVAPDADWDPSADDGRVLWPATPQLVRDPVVLDAAPLTQGSWWVRARVESDGHARIEPAVAYERLTAALTPVTTPPSIAPGGTTVFRFTPGLWPDFEFQLDTDGLAGQELWSTSSPVTTAGEVSGTFLNAGTYRIRVRPLKSGCATPDWTTSDEFDVGDVIFVAEDGDDTLDGIDPDRAVKTLARARTLADTLINNGAANVTVMVATGLYDGGLKLPANVTWLGGFDRTFGTRYDPTETGNPTSLILGSGTNAVGCVGGGTQNIVFDGFELQSRLLAATANAWTLTCGGVVDATIRNNRVWGPTSTVSLVKGVAMYLGFFSGNSVVEGNLTLPGGGSGEDIGLEAFAGTLLVMRKNETWNAVGIAMGQGSYLVEDSRIHLADDTVPASSARVGIWCAGATTNTCQVDGNIIDGDGVASLDSTGIWLQYPSAAGASWNRVYGGAGANSVGIRVGTAGTFLTNNVVHGGDGANSRIAIDLRSRNILGLTHNTVFIGDGPDPTNGGPTAVGVRIDDATTPLANNLFVGGAGAWVGIVQERQAGFGPQTLEHNAFAVPAGNSDAVLYRDVVASADYTDLGSLESDFCAGSDPARANLRLDTDATGLFADLAGPDGDPAAVFDNDWSPAATWTGVTGGGLDASTFSCTAPSGGCGTFGGATCGAVDTDVTGRARTVPTSIGAYEVD